MGLYGAPRTRYKTVKKTASVTRYPSVAFPRCLRSYRRLRNVEVTIMNDFDEKKSWVCHLPLHETSVAKVLTL